MLALFAAPDVKATSYCSSTDCTLPTGTTTPGVTTPGVTTPGTTVTTVTPSSYRNRWSTTFSLGMQWNFSDSRPELVAAMRRTETTTHQQVFGGQLDVTMPVDFADLAQKPVIRTLALVGNRDFQGQLGGGVETVSWQALATIGVQSPYGTAGANEFLNDGLKFYAGSNMFARVVAPRVVHGTTTSTTSASTTTAATTTAATTTYSCPSGYTLTSTSTPFMSYLAGVNPAVTAGGKTCYTNAT